MKSLNEIRLEIDRINVEARRDQVFLDASVLRSFQGIFAGAIVLLSAWLAHTFSAQATSAQLAMQDDLRIALSIALAGLVSTLAAMLINHTANSNRISVIEEQGAVELIFAELDKLTAKTGLDKKLQGEKYLDEIKGHLDAARSELESLRKNMYLVFGVLGTLFVCAIAIPLQIAFALADAQDAQDARGDCSPQLVVACAPSEDSEPPELAPSEDDADTESAESPQDESSSQQESQDPPSEDQ